jgi:hypothetical protein
MGEVIQFRPRVKPAQNEQSADGGRVTAYVLLVRTVDPDGDVIYVLDELSVVNASGEEVYFIDELYELDICVEKYGASELVYHVQDLLIPSHELIAQGAKNYELENLFFKTVTCDGDPEIEEWTDIKCWLFKRAALDVRTDNAIIDTAEEA